MVNSICGMLPPMDGGSRMEDFLRPSLGGETEINTDQGHGSEERRQIALCPKSL